ncbi:hypothetical protein BDY17DRAFT_7295 [Neohortaea acidophila]|uniref:Uncharacterized protein n=1 Tax=Neohortaea acidophila TaxID=245834 RepID=A0A6A6Q6I8_9PEZI|nr:uncharacterized protein BDY17DRAFT_7295 [Neohortaea acidophila]KAF2487253.1 hypothetical protein BDY17DRAFT_7295 [Neohortaea acidophila]
MLQRIAPLHLPIAMLIKAIGKLNRPIRLLAIVFLPSATTMTMSSPMRARRRRPVVGVVHQTAAAAGGVVVVVIVALASSAASSLAVAACFRVAVAFFFFALLFGRVRFVCVEVEAHAAGGAGALGVV